MFLYGDPLANKIISDLKTRKTPAGALVVIQLNDDPTSSLYIKKKAELARDLGIVFNLIKLPSSISFSNLKFKMNKFNNDKSIRAILVQMPLPGHLERIEVAQLISKNKDVDGFGYIIGNDNTVLPPTVAAISDLLSFYKISLVGKKVLIVGGGFLVGKPLYRYLMENEINVEVLDKNDKDYFERIRSADVVITSTGRGAKFTYGDFKKNATVIDASTVCEGGFTVGDVETRGWKADKNLAPVPGGVGPVTVAELFKNFFQL